MPRAKNKWRPRASQLGHYMACSYRACYDRAWHEEALELTAEQRAAIEAAKASSPYADLGTCIHHHLQAGIRASFPRGEDPPTPEQRLNASSLVNGNLDRLDQTIRASAVKAAQSLPCQREAGGWEAELSVHVREGSGHIDLLTVDNEWMVDLKTTSKPPVGRMKPAHLAQVLFYHYALEQDLGRVAKNICVLYVDSMAGAWAVPVNIDPLSEAMQEYRKHAVEYAGMLATKSLYKLAVPQIGGACEEWCPYVSLCRDRFLPTASGKIQYAAPKQAAPV